MSRKKFTDGWEGLFETATDTPPGESGLLFDLPEPTAAPRRNKTRQRGENPRHGGSKSFASDLESFLQEAFEESFAEQTRQGAASAQPAVEKTRKHPAAGGLDSLIRSTIEPDNLHVEKPGPNTRRLVLFLDEEKIAKLKSIARVERKVLRHIVDQIVAEFIAEYEKLH